MTNPDDDLLTTTEGVDEGSAASTVEDAGSGASPAAGGAAGAPTVEGQAPAPPVDVETDQTRAARAGAPGQQLEVGEG
jgi:hypothetical protein